MTRPLVLKKRSKFGAIRTKYNGVMYDSKREAGRAAELTMLQRSGAVLSWDRQREFCLEVNGQLVCKYRVDFVVFWANGDIIYEDVKGFIAQHSRIKMKLFQALHPDKTLLVVK